MNIQESIARVEKSLDLDKQFQTAMMACTAGRCNSQLIETFEQLEIEYQALYEETAPEDQLLTKQMLREKLADLKDWYARTLDCAGRPREAVEAFMAAADMFEAVGKQTYAQQSRDKAGELRLELGADFDAELERLHDRLEDVQAGSLDRVKVLIALGELHSKANDDFEAVKFLKDAEEALTELGGHPNDNEILGGLADTVNAINSGQQVAGQSSIELSIQRKALTQRVYLALGNVYRITDPARAAEYEEKLEKLDDGKRGDMRELLGKFLDSGQNVTKFLNSISDKD